MQFAVLPLTGCNERSTAKAIVFWMSPVAEQANVAFSKHRSVDRLSAGDCAAPLEYRLYDRNTPSLHSSDGRASERVSLSNTPHVPTTHEPSLTRTAMYATIAYGLSRAARVVEGLHDYMTSTVRLVGLLDSPQTSSGYVKSHVRKL